MQEATDSVREAINFGIKINGERVDKLRFADDIAVLANSEEELQRAIDVMERIMREDYNMNINKQKTKVLIYCRREDRQANLKLGNTSLQQVKEFNYLGIKITWDGKTTKEIKYRINRPGKASIQQKENPTNI